MVRKKTAKKRRTMILIPVRRRIIDGKEWKGGDIGYPAKSNAKVTAQYIRAHGKLARIIREKSEVHGHFYNIYSRRK